MGRLAQIESLRASDRQHGLERARREETNIIVDCYNPPIALDIYEEAIQIRESGPVADANRDFLEDR
jgi:hypothetical protein